MLPAAGLACNFTTTSMHLEGGDLSQGASRHVEEQQQGGQYGSFCFRHHLLDACGLSDTSRCTSTSLHVWRAILWCIKRVDVNFVMTQSCNSSQNDTRRPDPADPKVPPRGSSKCLTRAPLKMPARINRHRHTNAVTSADKCRCRNFRRNCADRQVRLISASKYILSSCSAGSGANTSEPSDTVEMAGAVAASR